MRERTKGNTLVAGDEGDDAHGVIIKLYGEDTNGAGPGTVTTSFASPAQFSRAFRSAYGLPPTDYRTLGMGLP